MTTLDELTESAVSVLINATYADRGDNYQRSGRIQGPRKTDTGLSALCRGSRPDPYRVTVTTNNGEIVHTGCTCPVAGPCKHVAALLYEWVRNPSAFNADDELETKLHALSKERVIELFADILQSNPRLREAVELELEVQEFTDAGTDGTIDYGEWYQRAEGVLQSGLDRHVGWGTTREVLAKLAPLVDAAHEFLGADQPENAAIAAAALFDALTANYQYFDDSGAHYSMEINSTADLVCLAFMELDDEFARAAILEKLWAIWKWDADWGGMGVMDTVAGTLMEEARPAERDFILDALDEYVDGLNAGELHDSSWLRAHIADFALELEADELDEREYLERCRELGDIPRLVEALLAADELDEAKRRAAEADVSSLLELTDDFIAYGHGDVAVELVKSVLDDSSSYGHRRRANEWLQDYYEQHERYEEALALTRTDFEEGPGVKKLKRLSRLARQTGDWKELQNQCLEILEQRSPSMLLQWHLEDNDPQAALATWRRHDDEYLFYHQLPSLADAVADDHPEVAIEIWTNLADKLIKERGRVNYRAACEHLLQVRNIYHRIGHPDQFTELARHLFDEHNRLRAFKDEMQKAGLAPE